MKKLYVQCAVAAFILLFLNLPLMATDGYFSLGYSTQSKGLAGAGVALYSNSLIGGNPAGNVFLGDKVSLGVSLFGPSRQYTISGEPSGADGSFGLTPGTVKSDKPVFFIPSIGGNWEAGKNGAFGFSVYGNGGMNTEYPTATFYGNNPTGINLSQLFANLTYSHKLADDHSIGISAIFGYQMFEAKGLVAFSGFSQDATKLTDNGNDNSFGYGVKVGYMGQLSDWLTLGIEYQSKIYMSEFKEYAGLFAEQGDFDVPSVWTVGVALNLNREFVVVADVKRINYTDVKSVSDPVGYLYTGADGALGGNNGAGFGWKDMMIYKAGFEYNPNRSDMTYRMGVSYGKQPISETEVMFNILAPGVSEIHITAGLSKLIDRKGGNEFHLSAMYSPAGSVSGMNPLDPVQTIELKMSQFEVGIGYSF